MERMNHGAGYEDDYPEHWPATRQRLENTAEWSKQFNDMVAEDHWNQKLMGFSAQQQVENALRGLLSAHNDPTTFRHGLNGIWEYYVATYYDPNNPGTRELYESVVQLLDHTPMKILTPPAGTATGSSSTPPTTVTTSHPGRWTGAKSGAANHGQ